jgi:hypothetical protein
MNVNTEPQSCSDLYLLCTNVVVTKHVTCRPTIGGLMTGQGQTQARRPLSNEVTTGRSDAVLIKVSTVRYKWYDR